MIITEIQLQNWKNFGEVKVSCGNRVFLIGPNASGKSNFLDALRFLRDVVDDGLFKAVTVRGGMKAVRYLSARKRPDITISITLDNVWQYKLSFTLKNTKPIVKAENVYKIDNNNKNLILDRPDNDDNQDTERLTQTAIQQVNINKEFRSVADFLSSIQYRHILPQLVRDPKSFSPSPIENDPYGRDLVSQIWNTQQKTRDARLRKINMALAMAVPKFKDLAIELDQRTGLPHLKVNYEHWRSHGAYQNESSFSDGTLRLLTLLWSLFDTDGPLLLEEPELSLHEEIVCQLPTLFTRMDKSRKKGVRQLFITTHAEAILRDPGIGANEILRFEPGAEGTVIREAEKEDIRMMEEGLTAAEVLLPKTKPSGIEQLTLSPL